MLDGSCRTPIGGLATVDGGELHLRGIIVKPDGSAAHEASRRGSVDDAAEVGAEVGAELRRAGGPGFFDG